MTSRGEVHRWWPRPQAEHDKHARQVEFATKPEPGPAMLQCAHGAGVLTGAGDHRRDLRARRHLSQMTGRQAVPFVLVTRQR
jgi:hypothetical protein